MDRILIGHGTSRHAKLLVRMYGAFFVKGVPQGSYPSSCTSEFLVRPGATRFFGPTRDRVEPGARRSGHQGWARSANPQGLVLDEFEHDGTLERVGMTKSEGSCRELHEGSCHMLVCGGPETQNNAMVKHAKQANPPGLDGLAQLRTAQ